VTSVGVVAHSGKSLGGGLGELRRTLSAYGINDPLWAEVPKSRLIPEQARRLRDKGVDLLFVWGGDGTVQRAMDALAGAPLSVAILPAGTANLFATNLGIPQSLEAAVLVGLHGARRDIDLGRVKGECFGVMAGVGSDAFMVRDADAGLKDKVGRIAYVWTGAKNLSRDPVKMSIDVDGDRWFKGQAGCVLIGNVGDVIGGISAFPEARPDDGILEIGVITAESGLDWMRTISRAALGDPGKSPFVRTTSGKVFDIRLDKALPFELDGGDRPKTKHLKVKVQPAVISLCVPKEETS
jgi:diacylglycerol kinase (ATP)